MVHSALVTPAYLAPLIDAYSMRVLTTVTGQRSVAASERDAAPTAKVRAPTAVELASLPIGKRSFSSRVTRSRSRKYSPAPAAVRTHDAETPAQRLRTPSSRTTHPAVANIPFGSDPARSLCACMRVLMTSNGCSARADTSPAEDPAMNEVVPLLGPELAFRAGSHARLVFPSAAMVRRRCPKK